MSLWCLTYIGSWFNAITLVILAWIAAFTIPKAYIMNQVQNISNSRTVFSFNAYVSFSLPLPIFTSSISSYFAFSYPTFLITTKRPLQVNLSVCPPIIPATTCLFLILVSVFLYRLIFHTYILPSSNFPPLTSLLEPFLLLHYYCLVYSKPYFPELFLAARVLLLPLLFS